MPPHRPEYLAEAAGLALFMVAASGCSSLLDHPASPVHQAIGDPVLRRALMGLAMGLTAMALIYSPAGARSGAHFNPSTTLTFYRLGRVAGADAAAYMAAQTVGAVLGVALSAWLFAPWVGDPAVRYAATVPGPWGPGAAFAAEVVLTFVLMTVVLHVSNHRRWSRYTGVAAGLLVATFIIVEAPVSGMSLNPARSFAPAVWASTLDTFWIYVAAPPLGMLAAAELYVRVRGAHRVYCAKLHHHTTARCIFHCRRDALLEQPSAAAAPSTPAPARGL